MSKKTLMILAAVAAVAAWWYFKANPDSMKAELIKGGIPADVANRMTRQELADSYTLLTMIKADPNAKIPAADPLAIRLKAIGVKYNIFT